MKLSRASRVKLHRPYLQVDDRSARRFFGRPAASLAAWFTREQVRELLAVLNRSTLKGKRDYLLLPMLVGWSVVEQSARVIGIERFGACRAARKSRISACRPILLRLNPGFLDGDST